ncbi:MAG: SGNH/GDSL hydrolase family protein [Lachnospiraceae bacterium]|nr:SGNH/GDSL hydrolase family protein [Lachnospiraceae bacterium]
MSKLNINKKNKYADINKFISRDVKSTVYKVYNSIKNILKEKSIENWKITVGALIIIIIFICMCVPKKQEKVDITRYPKNSFRGNDFVTKVYPVFQDVVVIGDSYSYFLGVDVGEDLAVYACPGLKLERLDNAFEAASNTDKKYAVIFIGPNDLMSQTGTDAFKGYLAKYVKQLKEKNKEVMIVTYLNSEYTDEAKKKFENGITVEMYDKVIQDVCKEENVVYIDAKDINDYHNDKRLNYNGIPDGLHFNQEFNIKLLNKIYGYIYDMLVEKNENK